MYLSGRQPWSSCLQWLAPHPCTQGLPASSPISNAASSRKPHLVYFLEPCVSAPFTALLSLHLYQSPSQGLGCETQSQEREDSQKRKGSPSPGRADNFPRNSQPPCHLSHKEHSHTESYPLNPRGQELCAGQLVWLVSVSMYV